MKSVIDSVGHILNQDGVYYSYENSNSLADFLYLLTLGKSDTDMNDSIKSLIGILISKLSDEVEYYGFT